MSSLKPLTLYSHHAAPNPWKVRTILSALNLPYTPKNLDFSEVKTEAYLAINPNGRLPAIIDPNTDITLWETKQWLAFQISGQGPYYGQATWFARFHPVPLPSATTRYVEEMLRVMGVLELQLSRSANSAEEGKWLVGHKCTFADLAFVTWGAVGEGLLREVGGWEGVEGRFPEYVAWMARLGGRREVREVREGMAEGRRALGLKP